MSGLTDSPRRDLTDSASAPMWATTIFAADGEVVRVGTTRPETTAFAVGALIENRYEIMGTLGRGGCGDVYSALDRELDVMVALKTLRPDTEFSDDSIAQLKREIQLARQVTHRNVCRIFDVGFHRLETGGELPFLTMELLHGESLAERLAREGRLAADALEPIALQVIDALAAAHAAGVVHADLKPGNIMLTPASDESGRIRAVVTDFGLATAHTAELDDRADFIIGTPAYMAPEQVNGDPLVPATDHYSLGCTLFHALTGELPFHRPSPFETAQARLAGDGPDPAERLEVPKVWSAAISGLLVLDPGGRTDGAGLRQLLDPPTRSRWPIALVAIAAVLLATAIAIGVVISQRDNAPPPLALSAPDGPAGAHFTRADQLLSFGASTEAATAAEAGLALGERHPRLLITLARARSAQGRRDEAVELSREAAAAAPNDAERDYYEAYVLTYQGKITEALELLARLADRNPDHFDIALRRAVLQRRQRAYELAGATLAKLEPKTDRERLALQMALAIHGRDSRNFRFAIEHAMKAVAVAEAQDAPILVARALSLAAQGHLDLGEVERGVELGSRARALAKSIDEPSVEALALSSLVAAAMRVGDFEAADELLEARSALLVVTDQTGLNNQLAITRAEVRFANGRVRGTLAHLTDVALPALRRDRNSYWEGYGRIVRSTFWRARARPKPALEDCHAGRTIFHSLGNRRLAAFGLFACGEAFLDRGEWDEAQKALDESLQIREAFKLGRLVEQSRLALADLALARGDVDRALSLATVATAFFASGEMANDEAMAQTLLARVQLVRGDLEAAATASERASSVAIGTAVGPRLERELIAARVAVARAASDEERAAGQAAIEDVRRRARKAGFGRTAFAATAALAETWQDRDADRAAKLRSSLRRGATKAGFHLGALGPSAGATAKD